MGLQKGVLYKRKHELSSLSYCFLSVFIINVIFSRVLMYECKLTRDLSSETSLMTYIFAVSICLRQSA